MANQRSQKASSPTSILPFPFLPLTGRFLLAAVALSTMCVSCSDRNRPPNIIIVITDDQGWAQVGFRGNDAIHTPHLDRLAGESVEFSRFYVSPVCAPTRASLMTGRYNYRTGVVDTYLGRAMMHGDEVTLPEILQDSGYRTGIFGKWHLGDNYPLRAMDQGFQEVLVHRGGGIGQPSDPVGNTYFDPALQHNGKEEQYDGYCTDIFFDAAIDFIDSNRNRPFFAYIPTNAPHSPYQVPDSYAAPYRNAGLVDKDARIYGMITNIDDNMGQLARKLDEPELRENTILIFMTDNGPTTEHYTAGLRSRKGSVYEGGIRVPFLVRWPARLAPREVAAPAAHIDIVPTLLEAIGQSDRSPEGMDGISLMPLLDGKVEALPSRTLYFQWHRGNVPELFRHFAAVGPRYKLLQPSRNEKPPAVELELYDLEADPGESRNLASEHPDIVVEMQKRYEVWFEDVSGTRGYDPPRITLGSKHENPVILTRQDWQMVGPDGWSDSHLGYWEVEVRESASYDVRFEFSGLAEAREAELSIGSSVHRQPISGNQTGIGFESIPLERGPARLEASLSLLLEGEKTQPGMKVGVRYVIVERTQ